MNTHILQMVQKSSMTLSNLVDGSSKVTNYNFDEMNRLSSIHPWTGDTVSYSYNLDGSRDSVSLPNNLTLHYSYDSLGRLLGMEYLNGNGQQVAFFNYTLDAAGNRTTMTDTEGLTEYTYDDLNRLTEATYPDGTWERFTMDVAGRRTRHEDQDGVSDYHYDIGDRLHSITGTNATTFTWDMNGNMMEKVTGEGITSYFYNARDKMVRVVLADDSELNYSYYPESDLRFSTIDTTGIEQRFLYEGKTLLKNWMRTMVRKFHILKEWV